METEEQVRMLAEAAPFKEFSDRPVAIKISANPTQSPQVCIVSLHRADRVPGILTRSLLLDEVGNGVFYGWMPVGLVGISVHVKNKQGEMTNARFSVRGMSMVEMFARIAVHHPRVTIQLLRLVAVGNIRGFQFRVVRECDGLNEPSYADWRTVYRQGTVATPHQHTDLNEPEILVSIVGDPSAAQATKLSLDSQTYPHVVEVEVTDLVRRHEMRSCDPIWIRLPAGSTLDDDAIDRLARPLIECSDIVGAYCDEDRLDKRGRPTSPFFKPAWNPPLAKTGWLSPDGAAIRLASLSNIEDLETASAGDLLMAASRHGKIAHVPVPLLHRSTKRRPAELETPLVRNCRPRVTVIIPTRDRADLLAVCLDGLLVRTNSDDLNVIVVDNDSREKATMDLFSRYGSHVRRIPMPGAFNFAKACNLGVAHARHELVLLLNNDVDPLHPDWLQHMAVELEDQDVGACGPLLLFPDGFVQHAGVTFGAGSVARHSFHFRHPDAGEDQQLISQRREISAVTAACLLTRKTLWDDVGGMNEEALAVAFNDVDYCLKLRDIGKKIIWTPHARLTHLESVSRKADDTPEKLHRFAGEEKYMHERWGETLRNDPYYNPNLSLCAGDYVLDALPRDLSPRLSDTAEKTNP